MKTPPDFFFSLADRRIRSSRRSVRLWQVIWAALTGLATSAISAAPNESPLFTVNSTADDPDGMPGDGICETTPGTGNCTLRAAIQESVSSSMDGLVAFDLSPDDPAYDGTRWTIGLLSALPEVATSLSFEGPGAKLLIVTRSVADEFRIFHVTSTGDVSFAGMTLRNGNAGSDNGGAILNDGGGTVNVTECSVEENHADRGGGISNQGESTLNVLRCAVFFNTSGRGGGITNQDKGTVNVTNTTIFGNDGFEGGGIRNSDIGSLNVSNCTIASNIGRGLANLAGGSFRVKSSVVAYNSAGTGSGDIVGPFNSLGYNFIRDASEGSGFTSATDRTGSEETPLYAGLADLADNGGPTMTLEPVNGSPLIDKGSSEGLDGTLTTDQRGAGYGRTFDDPDVPNAAGGDGTDIGAAEVQFSLLTPARLLNLSTRLAVGEGASQGIVGFTIARSGSESVVVRGIGPSLGALGVSGPLPDPMLELHDDNGAIIATNDNWRDTQEGVIAGTGLAPDNELESAIFEALAPGQYTAILGSADGTFGTGLVEVYETSPISDGELINLSTRGLVQTDEEVMIGGTIISGEVPATLLLRALGPSLPLDGTLADPTLELHDAQGAIVVSNDNWKDAQESEIEATGNAPADDLESAILTTLTPGAYSAIVLGQNDTTGIALLEFYR